MFYRNQSGYSQMICFNKPSLRTYLHCMRSFYIQLYMKFTNRNMHGFYNFGTSLEMWFRLLLFEWTFIWYLFSFLSLSDSKLDSNQFKFTLFFKCLSITNSPYCFIYAFLLLGDPLFSLSNYVIINALIINNSSSSYFRAIFFYYGYSFSQYIFALSLLFHVSVIIGKHFFRCVLMRTQFESVLMFVSKTS